MDHSLLQHIPVRPISERVSARAQTRNQAPQTQAGEMTVEDLPDALETVCIPHHWGSFCGGGIFPFRRLEIDGIQLAPTLARSSHTDATREWMAHREVTVFHN